MALQRLMAQAVMRPLTASDRMQSRWVDGRRTSEVVGGFIKANDRLASVDRLEIYNRQYWFRLLDCLSDDYPGLCAILGHRRFFRLIEAYLVKYPSTSPTLRELGHKLVDFLAEEPALIKPYGRLARDMARLEWAQIIAFDGATSPAVPLQRLGRLAPDQIFLRLQPYITLLDLSYPVSDVLLRLLHQDDKLRSEASNAMESPDRPRQRSIAAHIKPARSWLLVHRQDNSVYFKQLTEPQYRLLRAIDQGASLAEAFNTLIGLRSARQVGPPDVQAWFQHWTALGFFAARAGIR
jgi:hypothetical protein